MMLAPESNGSKGAILCSKNARQLHRDARTLSEHGSYGHAISLLVLSSEEAIKAILLYTEALGVMIDPKGADAYVKSHSKRHELARGLSVISCYLQLVDWNIEPRGSMDNNLELFLSQLIDDLRYGKYTAEMERLRGWWRGANDLKKLGFYVDDSSVGWVKPEDLTREQFQQADEMVSPIVRGARLIPVFGRMKVPKEFYELIGLDLDRLASDLNTKITNA